MSFFDFFRKKATVSVAVTQRLVWFELQVTPFTYRFAIIPQQPILIGGFFGQGGEKGTTLLMRYDHVPQMFEKTVEDVDALIRKHRILDLPCQFPAEAYSDGLINKPGLHLRLSYADNTRWADVFGLDQLPPPIAGLLADTQALARKNLEEMPSQQIPGEEAKEHIKPEANASHKNAPKVVVRVKVTKSGQVLANNQLVTLAALGAALDELKAQGGAVWYHREGPNEEPSPAVDVVIRQVLDLIMSRELPIQLQEEEI